MAKPADIPQDVWDAANRFWQEIGCPTGTAIPFVRLIVAERERCAKVADQHSKAKWGGPADGATIVRTTAASIATAIRNGGEA